MINYKILIFEFFINLIKIINIFLLLFIYFGNIIVKIKFQYYNFIN